MTTPPPARLLATLRSPEMLQDAMQFAGLNIRELSVACGKTSYRSMIGHLHSGHSNRCSVHLAGRIEKALRLPPRSLFTLSTSSTDHIDTSRPKPRKVAA